jgi:phage tail sheath protein FI
MSDYLHGVEQFLLENAERPITVLAASTIGLVATADDADETVFPLNVPTLCNSEKMIASAGTTGTLGTALRDIYRQTGVVVVVVRVEEGIDEAETVANVIGEVGAEGGLYTGINALVAAEAKVGVRPRLLVAPEFSHLVGVGTELETVAKKLNAIAIVDGTESGFSNVIAEAANFDEVLFVNGGIEVYDPDAQTTVTRKASATIAGHIVRVDNEEGYWNSPSNRKIYGITGTSELVDHAIGSKTSMANQYNASNVCTIVNQQGGFFFWGNRLANGGLLTHQRVRYIVGDSILYAHQEMLDRNVTKSYVEGVKNRVNRLLRRLIAREVISGGQCWLDQELNVSAIGTGQVYWDYDLGLFDVAERMTFRQYVNDSYNEAVFN